MYVEIVTGSLHIFNLSKRSFSASLAHIRIFSSPRFYFSASHANSPIVGASDIGQLSTLQQYSRVNWKIPLISQEMRDIFQ